MAFAQSAPGLSGSAIHGIATGLKKIATSLMGPRPGDQVEDTRSVVGVTRGVLQDVGLDVRATSRGHERPVYYDAV